MKHKKPSARILSLALSAAMLCSTMPTTVFAAEGDAPLGASSVEKTERTITIFDELGGDFTKSVPFDGYTYALTVQLNTPIEQIKLPTELGVTVERTTITTHPEKEEVQDSGEVPRDTAPTDEPTGSEPEDKSDAEAPPADKQGNDTTVTEVVQETITVTWKADREYTPDQNSKVIYTAELPEGYALNDGVALPQIYVLVGRQARAAAPVERTTPLDLAAESLAYVAADGNTKTADPTTESITDTDEGWSWDIANRILTLSGITLNCSTFLEDTFAIGINFPVDASENTIILTDGTQNTVDVSGTDGATYSAALQVVGSLTVKTPGNGTPGKLTAIAAPSEVNSYGIYAGTDFTVESGVIDATAGKSEAGGSYGIATIIDKIRIKGGTVTAKGDESGSADNADSSNESAGLYGTSIQIDGGTVNAEGNAAYLSAGIVGHDGVLLNGGKIDAKSDMAAVVSIDKDIIFDSHLTATVNGNAAKVSKVTAEPVISTLVDESGAIIEDAKIRFVPVYGGTQALAPDDSKATQTASSITLEVQEVGGETVEYGILLDDDTILWQDSPAFTGLEPGTGYTFYARVKESATHLAGKTSDETIIETDGTVDNVALTDAITKANDVKSGIVIADGAASTVNSGTRFVTTIEMKALTDAIAAAQIVANKTDANEAEFAAAIAALDNAVATFKAAVKIGTYSSGGGGGGGSSSGGGSVTPPTSNVINSKDASGVISNAVKDAIAAGGDTVNTSATFNNYDALTVDGLKTINEIVAKEAAGKAVDFKINFDAVDKNVVTSRITVDPSALAKVMTENLKLGVHFDQAKDAKVQAVNNLFEKHFTNKIVSVVFEQRSSLAINIEFCAKLNLADTLGTDKNLYFYSYDNVKNTYNLIAAPGYWVDKNGYAHINAPLGGSIIITNKPMTTAI